MLAVNVPRGTFTNAPWLSLFLLKGFDVGKLILVFDGLIVGTYLIYNVIVPRGTIE